MENKIRGKFGKKILFLGCLGYIIGDTYQDKFDRFTLGTYNAACEMFLLSKCNEFYGTPGSSGAYTEIEITAQTPSTLYIYCLNHFGMGANNVLLKS